MRGEGKSFDCEICGVDTHHEHAWAHRSPPIYVRVTAIKTPGPIEILKVEPATEEDSESLDLAAVCESCALILCNADIIKDDFTYRSDPRVLAVDYRNTKVLHCPIGTWEVVVKIDDQHREPTPEEAVVIKDMIKIPWRDIPNKTCTFDKQGFVHIDIEHQGLQLHLTECYGPVTILPPQRLEAIN